MSKLKTDWLKFHLVISRIAGCRKLFQSSKKVLSCSLQSGTLEFREGFGGGGDLTPIIKTWIPPKEVMNGHKQASAELDNILSFESGVLEQGNILNMQDSGPWTTALH